MDKSALEMLKANGHEVVEQFYAPEELGAALREFDAVVVRLGHQGPCQPHRRGQGRQAELIIRGGVGVDNIDVKYAEENGITVKNTPRASSNSVAELAMGHMFSCARFPVPWRVTPCARASGRRRPTARASSWAAKPWGIIGFGRIGQALGRMAKGIGMNVIAQDIYHVPGIEEEMGHEVRGSWTSSSPRPTSSPSTPPPSTA